jgi:hypothetical protein
VGSDIHSNVFLTSALVGRERSVSGPGALYPRRKIPRYRLDGRLGGPQSLSGPRGGKKNLAPTGTQILIPRKSSL